MNRLTKKTAHIYESNHSAFVKLGIEAHPNYILTITDGKQQSKEEFRNLLNNCDILNYVHLQVLWEKPAFKELDNVYFEEFLDSLIELKSDKSFNISMRLYKCDIDVYWMSPSFRSITQKLKILDQDCLSSFINSGSNSLNYNLSQFSWKYEPKLYNLYNDKSEINIALLDAFISKIKELNRLNDQEKTKDEYKFIQLCHEVEDLKKLDLKLYWNNYQKVYRNLRYIFRVWPNLKSLTLWLYLKSSWVLNKFSTLLKWYSEQKVKLARCIKLDLIPDRVWEKNLIEFHNVCFTVRTSETEMDHYFAEYLWLNQSPNKDSYFRYVEDCLLLDYAGYDIHVKGFTKIDQENLGLRHKSLVTERYNQSKLPNNILIIQYARHDYLNMRAGIYGQDLLYSPDTVTLSIMSKDDLQVDRKHLKSILKNSHQVILKFGDIELNKDAIYLLKTVSKYNVIQVCIQNYTSKYTKNLAAILERMQGLKSIKLYDHSCHGFENRYVTFNLQDHYSKYWKPQSNKSKILAAMLKMAKKLEIDLNTLSYDLYDMKVWEYSRKNKFINGICSST